MKRTGRTDDDWHGEAHALFAEGMKPIVIARQLGVSKERVCRVIDPGYAARRNELKRNNRIGRPQRRYTKPQPQISGTNRSVVKELWDGTRISLPRVAWLDRPMPGDAR